MARYESPSYTVLKSDGPFELRAYDAFSTSAYIGDDLSGKSGFPVLFNYISGRNETKQKISMTIPVINDFSLSQGSMEFVIPPSFHKEGIPKPVDERLTIKHYEPHKAVAVRFSGRINDKKIESYTDKLKAWCETNNIQTKGMVRLQRFNSPFSLPCLRHNEIVMMTD